MIIAIDFSLNSPGITIKKETGYTFISFTNLNGKKLKKIPKSLEIHDELNSNSDFDWYRYDRIIESKEFIYREREKLIDTVNVAESILTELEKYIDEDSVKIHLEGFSYGSKGKSFIDIIGYNYILRKMLMDRFGADNIFIFTPSQVKGLTGKGNANKFLMLDKFKENVLDDDHLTNTSFWQWLKDKSYDKKIPKPIDDIIDSYFLSNCTNKK